MKLRVLFIVMFMVFGAAAVTGAAKAAKIDDAPAVALYGNGRNKLNMIVVPGNSGLLYDNTGKVKILDKPSRYINPWKALHGGKFYVTYDAKGKNAVEYGKGVWTVINNFRVFAFRRSGPGEKAVGADLDSKIWSKSDDGKLTQIAEMKWHLVPDNKGVKIRALMTRTVNPQGKWTGYLGNRIMQMQNGGTLKQTGWFEWHVITQENGKEAAILMTKSMKKNAKWTGRFKGIIYRDK